MKFPPFWACGSADVVDSHGARGVVACWRSSETSQLDAEERARQAARRGADRWAQGEQLGHYGYGEGALREEVLQRIEPEPGRLIAAVTQNAAGAWILNTAELMFLDIDFPARPAPGGSWWRRLFGAVPPSEPEQVVRDRVESFARVRPDWGLRLYRTCAGMRIVATHDTFDPCDDATWTATSPLGVDPLYVRLCRAQGSFRARLTPKPWRCGVSLCPVRWPRSPQDERFYAEWQSGYETAQRNYATCRRMGHLGNPAIDPEIERLIELHDRLTRCDEGLELA